LIRPNSRRTDGVVWVTKTKRRIPVELTGGGGSPDRKAWGKREEVAKRGGLTNWASPGGPLCIVEKRGPQGRVKVGADVGGCQENPTWLDGRKQREKA